VLSGRGGFGVFFACIALLLHLAVPGLTAMPPVPPPAELQALQGILGDFAVALCSHAGGSTDPSDDPASPAPRHRSGHDCIACCSPASLAAVVPLAVPLPLPSGASVVEMTALFSVGPSLSIYAARQRGPPVA
jgi:Protein of unknown function (DUF2946)